MENKEDDAVMSTIVGMKLPTFNFMIVCFVTLDKVPNIPVV